MTDERDATRTAQQDAVRFFTTAWSREKALRETAESLFEKAVLADDFAERARLWRLYKEHRALVA